MLSRDHIPAYTTIQTRGHCALLINIIMLSPSFFHVMFVLCIHAVRDKYGDMTVDEPESSSSDEEEDENAEVAHSYSHMHTCMHSCTLCMYLYVH